jgi:hypothetical protein
MALALAVLGICLILLGTILWDYTRDGEGWD